MHLFISDAFGYLQGFGVQERFASGVLVVPIPYPLAKACKVSLFIRGIRLYY